MNERTDLELGRCHIRFQTADYTVRDPAEHEINAHQTTEQRIPSQIRLVDGKPKRQLQASIQHTERRDNARFTYQPKRVDELSA